MSPTDRNKVTTPESYLEHDFGSPVTLEGIRQDPEGYADIFCEGSPTLRQLLLRSWENGINTIGCCIGHEDQVMYCYTKDKLFGRGTENIDEAAYLAHANSKRYHKHAFILTAYFAFRPDLLGAPENFAQRIGEGLSQQIPDLPFIPDFNRETVSVALTKVVPPQERERFFHALSQVMERVIFKGRENALHEKNTVPVHPESDSFDARIRDAQNRAAETQKGTYPVKTTELEH